MERKHPNILLILTDQHRLSALGAYGQTPCMTPNLDRLAEEGLLFETAYTPCPVCSPARASIITGKYPHSHGITSNVHNIGCSIHELPDREDLLSRQLQRAGYRCGYTGKWHLGTDKGEAFGSPVTPSLPSTVGFSGQDFPGHGNGGFNFPEYREYLLENGFTHRVDKSGCDYPGTAPMPYGILEGPEESTVPYFLTEHSISMMEQFKAEARPFFMWHNSWGPHSPYYVTREMYELYRNVSIPPWPNFEWDANDERYPHRLKQHPMQASASWNDWEEALRHYYGFATLIDRQVGRLMDYLEESGLSENTIVIFSADHGETLGSHGGLTDKGWHHFEEIQRIPFIVRMPKGAGISSGTVLKEHASLLDLYPTILEAAGISPPENHGMSLLPFAEGKATAEREQDIIEFFGVNNLSTTMITLRYGRYKYGWNASQRDELYDLENDPWETENLLDRGGYSRIKSDMRERLRCFINETGHPAGFAVKAHGLLDAAKG
ncbi:MAG: sulfatase-like hydrolase/transferase [Spirochaetia bacterium]